jgi:hypothetical protein
MLSRLGQGLPAGPLALAAAALAWVIALILAGRGVLDPANHRAQALIWRDVHHYADFVTRPPAGLLSLVGLLVFLAAAIGPGDLLLRLFRPRWHDEAERLIFSLAAGLIVFTFATMLFCWTGLLRPEVLAGALALSLVASGWYASRWLGRSPGRRWELLSRRRSLSWPALGGILLGLVLAFYVYTLLLPALGPEVQHDARWYHLGVPKHYALHGGYFDIVRETRIAPAGLPQYQEMLYTSLIVLFGVISAKLLHWADAVLAVVATVYFCRAHFGSVRLGLLAGLIFISTPVVGWLAATATNDLPGSFLTLLAVHALLRWRSDPTSHSWLGVAALLTGYSIGVKPFGAFTLLLLVAGMAYFTLASAGSVRRPRELALVIGRRGAYMGVVAFVCCLPWLVHSFQLTGNPVFPLFNGIFRSPYWNDFTQRYVVNEYQAFGARRSPAGFLALPWDATVHGDRYRAILGPLFLTCSPLLLAALASGGKHVAALRLLTAFAVLWITAWFVSGALVIRYTAPVLPVVAIAVAVALWMPQVAGRRRQIARGAALALVLMITALNHQFLVPLQRYSLVSTVDGRAFIPWQYLYEGEPADEVYPVPMLSYLNANLSPADKVYDGCFLVTTYLYSDVELFNGNLYDSPSQMGQWGLGSPDALQRLHEAQITYVAICSAQQDVLRLPLAGHLQPVQLPEGTGHLLYRVDYSGTGP